MSGAGWRHIEVDVRAPVIWLVPRLDNADAGEFVEEVGEFRLIGGRGRSGPEVVGEGYLASKTQRAGVFVPAPEVCKFIRIAAASLGIPLYDVASEFDMRGRTAHPRVGKEV